MNYLRTLKDLYRLKKNVKLSAGKMRSLQDEKLRRILRFAWEHSAYYRAAFEHAGIAKEQLDTLPLSCFPAIDKQALLEHFSGYHPGGSMGYVHATDFEASDETTQNCLYRCHGRKVWRCYGSG